MFATGSSSGLSYGVFPTLPSPSLIGFEPAQNPLAVAPPEFDRTLARPFNIDPDFYGTLLHAAWPITIAAVYAVAVNYMNGVNARRKFEPWAISKTYVFYFFVLAHNIGLALFSGWVFVGMLNAVQRSWPGWKNPYGVAGVADALCKLHGPRGTGSAATFNPYYQMWEFSDQTMKLAYSGQPDSTDVGRIWNEGLAFYGFLFYLSKFYEVVDTMIILAKGKKSSSLQTFHHAGAMLCMWAGIRYMSPPIWMFTFINSGIHAWMYTYYTLTALTIRVPPVLKRGLTFLQIAQILFGASYAIAHLFIAYEIPVASKVVIIRNLSTLIPTATSAIASKATSLANSANIEAWLKKLALRAAGEEGLAENVRNTRGETFGIDAIHAAEVEKAQEVIQYKLTTQRVNCLDTSGQVFAILLNAAYLAPLAYLFIKFFAKNYTSLTKSEPPKPTVPEKLKESAKEAVEAIEDKVKQAMEDTQGGTTEPPPELADGLEDAKRRAMQIANDVDRKAGSKAGDWTAEIEQDLQDLRARATDLGATISEKAKETTSKAKKKGSGDKTKAADVIDELATNVKTETQESTETTSTSTSTTKSKMERTTSSTSNTTSKSNPQDSIKARGETARADAAKKAGSANGGAASSNARPEEDQDEEASNLEKEWNEAEGDRLLDDLEHAEDKKKPDASGENDEEKAKDDNEKPKKEDKEKTSSDEGS